MVYRLLIGLALLLTIAGCDSPQAARRTAATSTTVAPTDTVKVVNDCGTNTSAAHHSGNVAPDYYACYDGAATEPSAVGRICLPDRAFAAPARTRTFGAIRQAQWWRPSSDRTAQEPGLSAAAPSSCRVAGCSEAS